jgi:predicted ArsR family transcriptional regulator
MSAAAVSAMYLKQLPAFAVTLETLTTGVNAVIDPGQIRILRQRLAQWVEDLRSVGGDRALADAVEALVERLTRALAAPDVLRVEIAAISDELARLAAGAPPPPVKKKSRLAFWK